LLFDAATLGPLLEGWPANTDMRPILDLGAERARFLDRFAAGLYSFADHPVNLHRILARAPMAPVPYDTISIVAITPIEQRALAGWLGTAGRSGEPPPLPEWTSAVLRLGQFTDQLSAGPPPDGDWTRWVNEFARVEHDLHGRAVGGSDSAFYGTVDRYLSAHRAPEEVTAVVSLIRGLRQLDLEAAAAAADRMQVTNPAAPQMLAPDILLDAAVVAYLGAGRPDRARAAFDALSGRGGRPRGHVRSLVLQALVRAALERGAAQGGEGG
jgi:hypothetical protein